MNVIILRGGKQLDEPKTTQEEKGECVVKEKSKSPLEEEVIVALKDKE